MEETDQLVLQSGLQEYVKPSIPGYAVANPDRNYGTFGCLVRERGAAGPIYILSAAHVIANDSFGFEGQRVIQPSSKAEISRPIGKLRRWGALDFTPGAYNNLFDAAIAELLEDSRPDIAEIGRPTGYSGKIVAGMRVMKCGATTGRMEGTVIDPDFHCSFTYRTPDGQVKKAGFFRQVLCTRISEPGDSGAVVLDTDLRVLGLVIGGANGGTVFSRIVPILDKLTVDLV